MDYEKKYNEALETARKINSGEGVDAPNGWTKLEVIFPELRESEDEMIRRTLVEYFGPEVQIDLVRGIPIQKIRDWLEKQKEQKHPNGCFTCDEYKKGYEEGRRNGFTAGYNKAMKEVEQKEQKPAWSEEDDEMFHCICDSLCHLRKLYETNEDKVSDYNAMIVWFRSHFKSLRPSWKPSEEQMRCLCEVVDEAIRKHNESVSGYKPARVLESLYKQLQKL